MTRRDDEHERARRGGRPRATEPRSRVSSYILSKQHDALAALARQRGESLSAIIRVAITRALAPKP